MYSAVRHREWHRFTSPAQVCQGLETYYWAMFALDPGIPDGPVESFAAFLRTDPGQS
jgi:hypothetical protein